MTEDSGTFVSIYDNPDGGEEYYGYFSSVEDAERMWHSAFDTSDCVLVAICRVVKHFEQKDENYDS